MNLSMFFILKSQIYNSQLNFLIHQLQALLTLGKKLKECKFNFLVDEIT
jgi:hypothetical protein